MVWSLVLGQISLWTHSSLGQPHSVFKGWPELVCAQFLCVLTTVWLPLLSIVKMCTDVSACSCTGGLYKHCKSVCIRSWPWEKNPLWLALGCCWLLLFYLALFSTLEQTHCTLVMCNSEWVTCAFYCIFLNIYWNGVLTVLFSYVDGAMWKCWCLTLSTCSVYTIQPYTSLQCHLIPSHICRVHVCLGVACHLQFWQNGRGLLHATVVTQRWNRYWNESQHRKLTLDWLEKKICLPLLLGLKPATFWSQSWTCVSCWPYLKHDWATFLPTLQTLNETILAPPVPFSTCLCHLLAVFDVPFLERLCEMILAPPLPFSVELASWKFQLLNPQLTLHSVIHSKCVSV